MNMSITMEPVVKHFRKKNGRIIATAVMINTGNNEVVVGISRCNKKDTSSKKKGVAIALNRACAVMGLYPNDEYTPSQAVQDQERNLALRMKLDEVDEKISLSTFKGWACPYGATTKEIEDLKAKKAQKTKRAKTKK